MDGFITYIIALMLGFVAGAVSYRWFRKFPVLPLILAKMGRQSAKNDDEPCGHWSIGIYEGPTPFDIVEPEGISNPVLTGESVDDIDARFVADPFMVLTGGQYYVFFEALERKCKRGAIAYADSKDGKKWTYRQVLIREQFHLSYPYVFEWGGDYYLIPESAQDMSVRLYKASDFPKKWMYLGNLLSGYRYLDPSIFRHNNKWWLFVATGNSATLNLYYSQDLQHGWKPHPMNPIVKRNGHIARPGGRVIVYDGKVYRLAQDDDPSYGMRVFAFEVSELSEQLYEERLVSEKPVVTMTGSGWNAAGMHTVDLQKVGNMWMAVVDGVDRHRE